MPQGLLEDHRGLQSTVHHCPADKSGDHVAILSRNIHKKGLDHLGHHQKGPDVAVRRLFVETRKIYTSELVCIKPRRDNARETIQHRALQSTSSIC